MDIRQMGDNFRFSAGMSADLWEEVISIGGNSPDVILGEERGCLHSICMIFSKIN